MCVIMVYQASDDDNVRSQKVHNFLPGETDLGVVDFIHSYNSNHEWLCKREMV
jgi:hypothetical protein